MLLLYEKVLYNLINIFQYYGVSNPSKLQISECFYLCLNEQIFSLLINFTITGQNTINIYCFKKSVCMKLSLFLSLNGSITLCM